MRIRHSFKVLPLFIGLILFPPMSPSSIILKTKKKAALIHLEGLRTKRGSYFDVIDIYGRKRGIMKIKKVGYQKAIGVLKVGSFDERWSLEPIGRRRALAQIRRAKQKIAFMKEDQKYRSLKKQKLAQRESAKSRSPASSSSDEYIMDSEPKTNSYQSQDVLAYSEEGATDDMISMEGNPMEMNLQREELKASNYTEGFILPDKRFNLGSDLRLEYNFARANPGSNVSPYFMHGFGYGLFLNSNVYLTEKVGLKTEVGFNRLNVSTEARKCGSRPKCHLEINYVTGSLSLKYSFMRVREQPLWMGIGLSGMFPVNHSSSISLSGKSFSSLHGSVDFSLGLDLNFDKLNLPLIFKFGILPPTSTFLMGYLGLRLGISYNF